jgi:transcription antitermination factor NusG
LLWLKVNETIGRNHCDSKMNNRPRVAAIRGTDECDSEGEAVHQVMQARASPAAESPTDGQWYAVMTRPRHEKKVAEELQQTSVTAFLPVVTEVHRWSDRRKKIELPLFPGYVFVRLVPTPENKVSVLRLGGVLRFVGASGYGTPIYNSEIDAIRTILANNVPLSARGFLQVGQHVRIRGGALDGVQGILAECGRRLVVSVNAIQRSLALTLDGITVEPL